MQIKLYKVGGYVRDSILNIKSKDIDYVVEADSFEDMLSYVDKVSNSNIFLSKPEFFTIRALVNGEVADYRLCRKEGPYYDNRHPSYVEVANIFDDLSTRDFTCNAIAMADDGTIIDPFGGREDIENKIIRCVGDPNDRFTEDSLRILRAIRFSIKLGFDIELETEKAMAQHAYKVLSLPTDRIREELEKCFMMNTVKTVTALVWLDIFEPLFEKDDFWLMPTSKERPYVKKQKSVSS